MGARFDILQSLTVHNAQDLPVALHHECLLSVSCFCGTAPDPNQHENNLGTVYPVSKLTFIVLEVVLFHPDPTIFTGSS